MDKISSVIRLVLSSNKFWILILALTVLQGLWYAVSFAPILFDEKRHIDFIFLYTDYLSPFIAVQTPAMDFLGQVARESSYLYYYLMSFPLRLIELFTADYQAQVIALRIVNIGLFVGSMVIMRKAFLEVGIGKAIANTALLMFILVPTIAPLSGVVSYDTGALLLISYLLLISIRVFKKGRISSQELALLVVVSVLASVIKYTSLPVIVAIVLVLLVGLIWRRGKKILIDLHKSFFKSNIIIRILIVVGILLSVAIFIERPVQNYIKYGVPNPGCLRTTPKDEAVERCSKNYVSLRSINFLAAKPDNFRPTKPFEFLFNTWIPGMTVSLSRQVPNTAALPVIHHLFYFTLIGGTIIILLALREVIRRHKAVILLVAIFVVYVGSVYVSNYGSYVHLGQPVAISARYFMPIIPIFIVLLGLSISVLTSKQKLVGLLLVPLTLLLLTQGGSVTSYIIQASPEYYWQKEHVIQINDKAKDLIQRVVIE